MFLATAMAVGVTSTCTVGADGRVVEPNAYFHIEAGTLRSALDAIFQQTGLQYSVQGRVDLDAIRTRKVDGLLSHPVALGRLLAGTPWTFKFLQPCQFQVIPRDSLHASVSEPAPEHEPAALGDTQQEVRILARGILNADIPRTEDGPQPYVVIDRYQIERSPAYTVEGLIAWRMTANVPVAASQGAGGQGGFSSLNLRGLGPNQTLVLIDGRRAVRVFISGVPAQVDLTSLPLASVERIEILPTTASGIYGGGATGGVINVILRHECETRVSVGYGNSFSADTGNRRAYVSSCLQFGRSELHFSGNFSHDSLLTVGETDYVQRGRAWILNKNPGFFDARAGLPIGSQTNFRTLNGAPLNGAPFTNFGSVPAGYTRADGIGPLLQNAGQYNLGLADSAQNTGSRFALRNAPVTQYFNVTLNQPLWEDASAYVDLTRSVNVIRRPENVAQYARLEMVRVPAAVNPFGQDLVATVPVVGGDRTLENKLRSNAVTAGLELVDVPWIRNVSLEGTLWRWEFERIQPVATAADMAVASGALDVFRDLNIQPIDLTQYVHESRIPSLRSGTQAVTLRFGSSQFDGPARRAALSGSLEYREERFTGGPELMDGISPVALYTDQTRSISSAYLEARVPFWVADAPLTSATRQATGAELQLATRVDRYRVSAFPPVAGTGLDSTQAVRTDFSSVNPTIGLRAWPVPSLMFRGSFGTGFLPPTGDQFAPGVPTVIPAGRFRDSLRGESTDVITLRSGGNPNVEPERSKSWSIGIVLQPSWGKRMRASIDYVQIEKLDNIVSPADLFFQDLTLFQNLYPGRVKRAPAIDGVPGRIVEVDATVTNVARARVEAWDLAGEYVVSNEFLGEVTFRARGTWQPTLDMWATPRSAKQRLAGVSGNGAKVNAIAEVAVRRRAWEFSLGTRYLSPYRVPPDPLLIANQGDGGKVAGQMYQDATVAYHILEHANAMSVTIQFTGLNVFNKRPPIDVSAPAYVSELGDPRRGTYWLSTTAVF